MNKLPFISIIIKTFNEEEGIAETITSVQKSISQYPHQIIVADSLSDDQTQEIAMDMGVKVVSLVNSEDRCCGVGHQLGYLHSEGDYLLLLDGDMQLSEAFIEQAVLFLEQNSQYAAVAGRVEMDDAKNYEFQSRKQRLNSIYPLGDVHYLAGGGLYRRSAIEEIGYLTNRNLHAYEEAELGIRLTRQGYKLCRLDVAYFHHTSYSLSTFQLLKYRWKSKYLCASGELLRGAWGEPHFKDCLKIVQNEVIYSMYLFAMLLSVAIFNGFWTSLSVAPLVAFFLLKAIRNRSLLSALHSVVNLTVFSMGLIRGLLQPVKDPTVAPENKVVSR